MTLDELRASNREWQAKWRSKPENKVKRRQAYLNWLKKPGNKELKAEYDKAYAKRPSTIAWSKAYHSRPDVKAKKNARTAIANVTRDKHKNCTPAWYDKELATEYYLEAIEADGKHEVDHIVPIRCDTVCGLNVHYNLQVLKLKVNRRKNNEYDSDMILEIEEEYLSLNYKAKGAQQ